MPSGDQISEIRGTNESSSNFKPRIHLTLCAKESTNLDRVYINYTGNDRSTSDTRRATISTQYYDAYYSFVAKRSHADISNGLLTSISAAPWSPGGSHSSAKLKRARQDPCGIIHVLTVREAVRRRWREVMFGLTRESSSSPGVRGVAPRGCRPPGPRCDTLLA